MLGGCSGWCFARLWLLLLLHSWLVQPLLSWLPLVLRSLPLVLCLWVCVVPLLLWLWPAPLMLESLLPCSRVRPVLPLGLLVPLLSWWVWLVLHVLLVLRSWSGVCWWWCSLLAVLRLLGAPWVPSSLSLLLLVGAGLSNPGR